MSKIVALVGSTASGKSDIALKAAKEHGAEILSCDSLLVYRGLNIGTAKPSNEELALVKHHGVDIVDLTYPYTAGDYVRCMRPILDRLIKENKHALIIGGTGFYLKGLVCGVWDAPPTHLEIRERLEKEANNELYARLLAVDPEYAQKIKAGDRYRVIRALEIIEVTGEPVSCALAKKQLLNPLPYPISIFGIKRTKMDLERRIVERTNFMFQKGLVAETKALLAQYSTPPRPFFCVGYNEVTRFLSGQMTLPECRERIVISTRQLAKKQMTFFKTFPSPILWHNLPSEEEELFRVIRATFNSS